MRKKMKIILKKRDNWKFKTKTAKSSIKKRRFNRNRWHSFPIYKLRSSKLKQFLHTKKKNENSLKQWNAFKKNVCRMQRKRKCARQLIGLVSSLMKVQWNVIGHYTANVACILITMTDSVVLEFFQMYIAVTYSDVTVITFAKGSFLIRYTNSHQLQTAVQTVHKALLWSRLHMFSAIVLFSFWFFFSIGLFNESINFTIVLGNKIETQQIDFLWVYNSFSFYWLLIVFTCILFFISHLSFLTH